MLADKKLEESRLNICRSCEHFINMKRCAKCGCYMPVKAKLINQRCPMNKWPSVQGQ